jgi:hypothetical protein
MNTDTEGIAPAKELTQTEALPDRFLNPCLSVLLCIKVY